MADFCRTCVDEVFGHTGSDFPAIAGWYGCEGCGVHFFDEQGRRICGLPTPPEDQVYGSGTCPACLDALRAEFNP